jgi:hypothetical protein
MFDDVEAAAFEEKGKFATSLKRVLVASDPFAKDVDH